MTSGRLGGWTALWLAVVVGACAGLLEPAWALGPSVEPARAAIGSCLKKLNPDIDVGYERIAARCPDLARRLDESGWSAWLPADWKRPGNDLSAGGLRELADLLAPQSRDAVGSDARLQRLNTAHLPAVLASLAGGGAAEHNGWWARTKAWLRDLLERDEEEQDDWFSRVVGESGLSEAVIELVSYAALVLVVVLAVMIVVNELRVGGLFARLWRRFFRGSHGRASAIGDVGSLSWGDIRNSAPTQQPRLLLESIASRLTAIGQLPQSRGFTIREMMRTVRLSDGVDRERLAELARLCERVTFSNEPVTGETAAAALEGGRVLLERIEQRP